MDARHAAYLDLLEKWNAAYNLTAVRDRADMAVRHIADSLSVLPLVTGDSAVDVGTGAGLPGLVLAIADPGRRYTLLDSNGKKVRFCEYAIRTLQVDNAVAVQARVEAFRPAAPFDTVISRAFATVREFVELAGHLCGPEGRMLAMKGTDPAREVADLPSGWGAARVDALEVPGLRAERHVAILTRT